MAVTLSREAARRIALATRLVENAPRTALPERAGPRVLIPTKYAIITTTIAAASGGTFGLGAGTLQLCQYATSGVGTHVSTGITVPIYSGASASIATGRLVIVSMIDGRYHVSVDFC